MRFGDQLAKAIERLKQVTGSNKGRVRDEIGYLIGLNGGRSLERWQTGPALPNPIQAEGIVKYCSKNDPDFFDAEWASNFLSAGNHPKPEEVVKRIYGEHLYENKSTSSFGSDLASTTINTDAFLNPIEGLFGREAIIQEIQQRLEEHKIVMLTGQGGIGKSIIAREISERAVSEGWFEQVFWQAAPSQVVLTNAVSMTYESIIVTLYSEISGISPQPIAIEEKIERVKYFFQSQTVLLILDNMETASEPIQSITTRIIEIIGQSRVLITSRHRLKSGVNELFIEGFSREETADFIQTKGSHRGVPQVAHLSEIDLDYIWQQTGGSPLALQLILSHLNYLSLDIVLGQIKELPPLSQMDKQNEYLHFYRYIFQYSWRLLDLKPKELLVTLARFSTINGADYDALLAISQFQDGFLPIAIEKLWSFSLLDTRIEIPTKKMRYLIHPLTQHFVLADIAEII